MQHDVERNFQLSGDWFNEMANFVPRCIKSDSKFKYHQACCDSTLNLPEKPAVWGLLMALGIEWNGTFTP